MQDIAAPTAEIRAHANELTRGLTTEREKIEALYDFVAKHFRTASLSFGVGRFQPHAAGEGLAGEVTRASATDPADTAQSFDFEIEFTFTRSGYLDTSRRTARVELPVPRLELPEASADAARGKRLSLPLPGKNR